MRKLINTRYGGVNPIWQVLWLSFMGKKKIWIEINFQPRFWRNENPSGGFELILSIIKHDAKMQCPLSFGRIVANVKPQKNQWFPAYWHFSFSHSSNNICALNTRTKAQVTFIAYESFLSQIDPHYVHSRFCNLWKQSKTQRKSYLLIKRGDFGIDSYMHFWNGMLGTKEIKQKAILW